MALDDLAATIETIKERIVGHRTSLAANETRTRQVLIDPLLIALGWDVSDPNQVELEYDVRGRRADYALMVDTKPVAVIEAKRLGHQLVDDNTMQVMNYANTAGIEYMVVTNGDDWKMYSVFERGAIEERVIMELRITGETSHANALRSLSMWGANLNSSSAPIQASQPALVPDEPTAPDRPRRNNVAPETDHSEWIPLDEVKYYSRAPRPNRIRFPDQHEVGLRGWNKAWISIAEWVADREPTMTACRFGDTKPTVIKTTDEGFWANGGHQLSNGLWIEPGVTGNTLLRTARSFLEYFDVEPGSVLVRFDKSS